jgi:hypothetical protein
MIGSSGLYALQLDARPSKYHRIQKKKVDAGDPHARWLRLRSRTGF